MKLQVAILLAGLTFGSGCSLIPKPVEFGQKKVKPFPEKTEKFLESQRQAAWLLDEKTQETHDAALAAGAPPTVTRPSGEALLLAGSVSESLGPPLSFPDPAKANAATVAAQRLGSQQAYADRSVRRYATQMEPLEGKKVEGTGWLQVPYLVYLGVVVLACYVAFIVGKLLLSVAATANPAAGVGLAAVNLGGRAVGAALRQVVHGGEAFKAALEKTDLPEQVKSQVKSLFRAHQEAKQDEATKQVVDALTQKPGE